MVKITFGQKFIIIGDRIDCNGVGVLRGQQHIPSKK